MCSRVGVGPTTSKSCQSRDNIYINYCNHMLVHMPKPNPGHMLVFDDIKPRLRERHKCKIGLFSIWHGVARMTVCTNILSLCSTNVLSRSQQWLGQCTDSPEQSWDPLPSLIQSLYHFLVFVNYKPNPVWVSTCRDLTKPNPGHVMHRMRRLFQQSQTREIGSPSL